MHAQAFDFKSIPTLLKKTASNWMEDGALRLSAALAYYSIFSIAPLLVIMIGLAGLFFGQEAVSGQLDDQLSGIVGAESAKAVQSMVQSASKPSSSIWATVLGVVTLMIGASSMFGQLKDALNTIWEVKPKAGLGVWGFIRERLLSFGMVLMIGFLLLVSLLLTAMLGAFNHMISGAGVLPTWVWGLIGFFISFAVVSALFALIFKFLPDVKVGWRHVWIGAVVTALLFEIGKFGLGWYLGRPSTASSYGAAGSVILLLLWIYYASCILLFGAEFTQVFAEASGAKIQPSEIAEPVTAEARAQQGLEPEKSTKAETVPAAGGSSTAITAPPRESPMRVLGIAPAARKMEPRFPRSTAEIPRYLQARPEVGLLAAIGGGFLVGLLTRGLEHEPHETPAQKVASGSKALALTGLLFSGKMLARTWKVTRSLIASGLLKELSKGLRKALPLLLLASSLSAFAAPTKPEPRTAEQLETATRLQAFLDQAYFGPGKIDGRDGEFTRKALALYREANGLSAASNKDPKAPLETADLDLRSIEPVFISYTLTKDDLANVGDVPTEVDAEAKLKALPYRSALEEVAEKFHCDIDFLKELNPSVAEPLAEGTMLTVPNVQPFEIAALKPPAKSANKESAANEKDEDADNDAAQKAAAKPTLAVQISTKEKLLEVRDGEKLVAVFPITSGSEETVSPIGQWKVKGVAKLPTFRYDKKMLQKGERSSDFHMLPPGPNNPVGVMWIALNKKGIGIHGTDDPDSIGRSASHGCIRLANWDVVRLAEMLKPGVPVTIQ